MLIIQNNLKLNFQSFTDDISSYSASRIDRNFVLPLYLNYYNKCIIINKYIILNTNILINIWKYSLSCYSITKRRNSILFPPSLLFESLSPITYGIIYRSAFGTSFNFLNYRCLFAVTKFRVKNSKNISDSSLSIHEYC